MIRRSILLIAVAMATTSASTLPASAWDSGPGPAADRVLSAGRVITADADAGRITIEHKPIQHLYMESMTMIFRVKDPAMLVGLRPGDKIRFKVERDDGRFVITRMENSN